MPIPRPRFTLAWLMLAVALLAIALAGLRSPFWPIVPPIEIILIGFAIDRSRGGSGIRGAMIGGIVGFAGVALGCVAIALLTATGPSSQPRSPLAVLVAVLASGLFGWGVGMAVGIGASRMAETLDELRSVVGRRRRSSPA